VNKDHDYSAYESKMEVMKVIVVVSKKNLKALLMHEDKQVF
jgi:hypothetical protein